MADDVLMEEPGEDDAARVNHLLEQAHAILTKSEPVPDLVPETTVTDTPAVTCPIVEIIDKAFRDQSKHAGTAENGFQFRKGSHPVVSTEIFVSGRAFIPVTELAGRHIKNDMCVRGPDAVHLPRSWAPQRPNPIRENYRQARQVYAPFVPMTRIAASGSMTLSEATSIDKPFSAAWEFLNRAVCTRKVGGCDPETVGRKSHMFKDPVTGRALPKIAVIGEVVVKKSIELFDNYTKRAYPNASASEVLSEEFRARVAADLQFRTELLSNANMCGIRYWIFVFDPKLDLGAALQRLLWRNQVKCGMCPPTEIVLRADAMRESIRLAMEKKAAGKEGAPPPRARDGEEEGDSEDKEDNAAAVHELDDVDANEEAQARAAKEAEAREAARQASLDSGGEEKKASGGNGQKSAKDKGRELLAKKARAIGLLVSKDGPDKQTPTVFYELRKKADERDSKRAQGIIINGRRTGDADPVLSELDTRRAIDAASGKRLAVVLIRNIRDIVSIVYENLLNCGGNREMFGMLHKDFDKIDSEAHNLGDWSGPYHPKKWLNFDTVNNAWRLTTIACKEQTDLRYYFCTDPLVSEPRSLSFKPSIPSLAWELAWITPDRKNSFKSKWQTTHERFYACRALQEGLQALAIEKAEMDRAEEEERKANAKHSSEATTASGLSAEHLVGLFEDEETRAKVIARELEFEKKYAGSLSRRLEDRYARKYDGVRDDFGSKESSSSVQRMNEIGISDNAAALRERVGASTLVRDIIGDCVSDYRALRSRVNDLCRNFPGRKPRISKLLYEHQFENVFKPLMKLDADKLRPNHTYGMGSVHMAMLSFLSEGNPHNPKVVFEFVGFKNLTLPAAIIADFHLRAKTYLGISSGLHVFWAMFINSNISAYDAQRLGAVHTQKVGAPGTGKSFVDMKVIDCKVEHTVTNSIHTTASARLVEVPQDNMYFIEDEASGASILDPSKVTNQGDMKAQLNLKNWLSSATGQVGYTAFSKDANSGRKVESRLVDARGVLNNNTNNDPRVKDSSLRDRFLKFLFVPESDATSTNSQVLASLINHEARERGENAMLEKKLFDRLVFGLCQCVNLGGAAPPNVDDLVIHLMRALPKVSKYGIGVYSSVRRLIISVQLGITNTYALALMQAFYGDGPTVRREYTEAGGVKGCTVREWREDFMKAARMFMFMTEPTKFYTLSQIWRQLVTDYSYWDTINFIARMYGYSDTYFEALFQDAWTDPRDPTDRRRKKFKFMDYETYRKKVARTFDSKGRTKIDYDRVDTFVEEEERTFARWEKLAVDRRGKSSRNNDPNIVMFPSFAHTEIKVGGKSAMEHQMEIEAYLHTTSAPVPVATQAQGTVRVDTRGVSRDAESTRTHDILTESARGKPVTKSAPNAIEIDPNWLVIPKPLDVVAQEEVSELGKVCFKHHSTTVQAILQMCDSVMINVPELEKLRNPRDALSFKTTSDGKVVVHNVPVCTMREVREEICDLYTGLRIPPGRYLHISTMALRCFRARLGLSIFLKCAEYEFTPTMQSVVDIAVSGHDGILHVHKSFPRPGRHIKRERYNTIAKSVLRSLSLESHQVLDMLSASDSPEAMNAVKTALDKKQEQAFDFSNYGDFIEVSVEAQRRVDETYTKKPSRTKERESSEAASGNSSGLKPKYRRKDVARTVHSSTETNKDLGNYTRYHINELFEEWAKREYDKPAEKHTINGVKRLSDKYYYPGQMELIMKERVKMGPQYLATRLMFGGSLPRYPADLIDDLNKAQDRAFVQRRANSYLGISMEEARETREYLRQQLAVYRKKNEEYRRRETIGDHVDQPAAAVGRTPTPRPEKKGSRKRKASAQPILEGEDSLHEDFEDEPPVGAAMAGAATAGNPLLAPRLPPSAALGARPPAAAQRHPSMVGPTVTSARAPQKK